MSGLKEGKKTERRKAIAEEKKDISDRV